MNKQQNENSQIKKQTNARIVPSQNKQQQNRTIIKQLKQVQKQMNNSVDQNNGSMDYDQLEKQNKILKKKNTQLIAQLQIFSKKLDEQLKKRISSSSKKPKIPQQKQSIQVQNLYKKIQIYKKQISLLKSKISDDNQIKLNDYQNKSKMFLKENQQLKQQIKSLKKVMKLQSKGLAEIGAEGFLKITAQNQKLKEEIRKLRLQKDQMQRKNRVGSVSSNNLQRNALSKDNIKIGKLDKSDRLDKSRSYYQDDKVEHHSGKKLFQKRRRMRTQADIVFKGQKKQQKQSQLNMIKQRQKHELKIRNLTLQKQRNRQIMQNLKIQIVQKDKQIHYLKQKIEGLRKIIKSKRFKVAQNQHKVIKQQMTQSLDDSIDKNQSSQSNSKNGRYTDLSNQRQVMKSYQKQKRSQRSQNKSDVSSNLTPRYKQKVIPSQKQKIKSYQKILQEKQIQEQIFPAKDDQNNRNIPKNRYPRFQQKGVKNESNYKWNHFPFSSKIKQIQINTHPQGMYISNINVRYQKGQPFQQNNTQDKKTKSQGLVCEQSQQFVQFIKGGFKNGYLQYFIVKTNRKRVAQFGNIQAQSQCDNFVFNISAEQYPSAFAGQNDNNGVTRLGCFIQKLAKQSINK